MPTKLVLNNDWKKNAHYGGREAIFLQRDSQTTTFEQNSLLEQYKS